MSRLVPFLGRKSGSVAEKPAPSPPPARAGTQDKGDIELDNDLFFPLATQLGQENEAIRNLLMDAEHKIDDLENIKRSIGKLVDPVVNTLRAYEQTKNEKLSLQSLLNSTRIAHNKVRQDLASVEKKAATLDTECIRLREMATVAQQSVAALERIKTEHTTELNARRTQVAELQRLAQQQGSELQITRDENRRISERFVVADKRVVQLESECQIAQHKVMQTANERVAVQAALDKALNDYSQTARKLTETDKALIATQAKLKAAESSLVETHAERTRLSTVLDETRHKHLEESSHQNSRFEALQARAALTESLLDEARQTLMARAEENRVLERRVTESSDAHGDASERLAQLTSALAEREQQIKDFERSQATLSEQNQTLTTAVVTREAAYNRVEQKLKEQEELLQVLEGQIKNARDASELQIEQLNAQLQRERIERAMAEGALESGRKDLARLMREIMAMKQRPEVAPTPTPAPAASAATPDSPDAPAAPGGTANRLKSAA